LGDRRARRQVRDVLAEQQAAAGQRRGVDDVAVLLSEHELPRGAAVAGAIDAALWIGVAEVDPQRVRRRIGGEAVAVAMALEGVARGPGGAVVRRRPEADRRGVLRERLVLDEVDGAVELG